MKSMTGFGHGDFRSDKVELDVNLRVVNGRFFEMRLHLPKELLFLESKFKKIINQKIARGTVDLYINRRVYYSSKQGIKVESKLAKDWVKAFKKLSKDTGLPFELSLSDLAQLPGVATTHESSLVSVSEKTQLLTTVKEATQACIAEREREGMALKSELNKYLTQLGKQRKKMESLRLLANKELRLRYKEKLKKWSHYDENRMAQEVSNLIDKADINEEISRLGEHVKGCKALLLKKEPVGKKMDFYSQEILREINTIGSKSQVSKLTEAVVDAKSIIERFREQVQNVE